MADNISAMPDAAFLDMGSNMLSVLNAAPAKYPCIPATLLTQIGAVDTDFDTKLDGHVGLQAQALAGTTAKNLSRAEYEALVRMVRNLCNAAKLDQSLIDALGIPKGSTSAPATSTRPIGMVDTSQRLRHTISWLDEATPDNKRKPRGVLGLEIWCKIGDPAPGSEKDCQFLTLDTRTPYLVEHDADDAGKVAYYMLRWRLADGSFGPWGETLSATITA